MKVWLILLLAIGLSLVAAPALAHRLDDYLQTATIDVEADHIALEFRLTPGIDVAPQVLASIDTDGNGTISGPEQAAYAGRVQRDLSLVIDGRAQPLRLVDFSFPTIAVMKSGAGEITLAFVADLPPGTSTHNLRLENHHQSAISVYLANALVPRDPIRIVRQNRSFDQSSYLVEVAPEEAVASRLEAPQRDRPVSDGPTLKTFFWHGVQHILTGYDHLLFIGALVLGAATLWDLVKVVTAFTLAHSITLTLSSLDLVLLPEGIVEPLISGSIIFVALQNILRPDQSRGHSRLAVAFCFGLFHGLGFAGGLHDIMGRLPWKTMYLAILGFSLGIEAGNQMVLLPLFGLLRWTRRLQPDIHLRARLSRVVQRVGSAVVSAAGAYYFVLAVAGAL